MLKRGYDGKVTTKAEDLLFNLDDEDTDQLHKPKYSRKPKERYFSIPFPEPLLCKLLCLPLRTLKVALLCWRHHCSLKGKPFTVSVAYRHKYNLYDRANVHRALVLLAQEGFVTLRSRGEGKSVLVQVSEDYVNRAKEEFDLMFNAPEGEEKDAGVWH